MKNYKNFIFEQEQFKLKPIVKLDFPELRQVTNFDCGVTAVQQVLIYYGIEKREDELIKLLDTKKTTIIEHGTKLSKMIEVFKYFALDAEVLRNSSLKEIKKLIDNKIPPIILMQAWRDYSVGNLDWIKDYSDGHYCFLPNTSVLTDTGYREIKDIQIGDMVLTHTGKLNKVISTGKRKYKGDVLEIKANGMIKPLVSTPEHPYFSKIYKSKKTQLLKQKNPLFSADFIPAKNLSKDNLLFGIKYPTIDCDDINFNRALLLGLYTGDGNLHRNDKDSNFKGVRFIIGIKETNVIEKIKNLMYVEFGLDTHYYYPKNNDCVQLIYYSTEMAKYFFKYCGGPSNKEINNIVLSLPNEKLINFVEGWYLTDGSDRISLNHSYRKSIMTASIKLAYSLKIILEKLQISFSVSYRKPKKHQLIVKKYCNTSEGFDFSWIAEHNKKAHSVYYNDNKITRISSIKNYDYDGYVYNLEVENDNTYIAEGFIVHNCVAVGYNDNCIFFEDPSSVTRTYLSFDEFEKRWHDVDDNNKTKNNHVALVVKGEKKYNSKLIVHMD